ncbi:MAG: ATP-dependent sacrificial sulfur transferase LarE [Candidatus Bathyarchaeota archaeon]|nr:ATP-dependent sacrificial sulfur transferase LarE [Candidatus Bathyarchaeota archaeon]
MNKLEKKIANIEEYIKKTGKGGAVVAFSGGVDSSTLAAVCHKVLGKKAVAATAQSPTYTTEELKEAKDAAREIGIKLIVVKTNELDDENFVENSENRCYYCKKALLAELKKVAEKLGFEVVFEGTNISDLKGHRPGFQAVKETSYAYSPWVEIGFSKEEIRQIATKLELKVQDKPSNACLASRIPFNEKITAERLERIRKAEQVIKKIAGVRQLRVRDHNGLARIEVEKTEQKLLFENKILDKITTQLKVLGFRYVTVDAEGYRTGSMLSSKNSA